MNNIDTSNHWPFPTLSTPLTPLKELEYTDIIPEFCKRVLSDRAQITQSLL